MTDEQIKHMVDRFLGWRLPEDFHPDAGISFKPTFNDHTKHPMRYEPTGTNLLDATQATAMIRHLVKELPSSNSVMDEAVSEMLAALKAARDMWAGNPTVYRQIVNALVKFKSAVEGQ